jgi:hypothetical protein
VNDFRVRYIRGKVPHWLIQYSDGRDIALTPEDALRAIGRTVIARYDRFGGEFTVTWDDAPRGFQVPDIEGATEDEPILPH